MSNIGTALTRFKYTTIQAVPGPQGPQGAQGPQGIQGAGVTPLLFSALASQAPSGVHDYRVVDGYAAQGDGGGGLFVWNPNDVRVAPTGYSGGLTNSDGGTYVQATGIANGRWNRVVFGPVLSVKWFGAKGDATTDDTAAIQNAIVSSYANQFGTTQLAYSFFALPAVYFPAGAYKLTSELQCSYFIKLFSDQQALLFTASTSNNILRAGPPQFVCEGLSFSGGRHAIIFGGLGSAGIWGSAFALGSYTNGGFSRLRGCQFLNQAGPSVMADTTQAEQQRTVSSQLTIEECFFQTPAAFWGSWDQVNIKMCWGGGNDAQVSAPLDGNGRTIAFITTADRCVVMDCDFTPQYATAVSPVWVRQAGQLRLEGVSFGGEGSVTVGESFYSTAQVYNGNTLFVDPTAVPQVEMRGGTFSGSSGIPWWWFRDTAPNKFVADAVFSGTTGVLGTPPPMQDFYPFHGIWVDSAINLSALQSRPNLVYRFAGSPIGAGAFRFFQSASPSTFGVDVSSVIRKHLAAGSEGLYAAGHSYPGEGARQENNLWFQNVIEVIDTTANGFNINATGSGNTGATESISGLGLHILKATADNGFYTVISKTGWNPAIPAGDYVFAFEIVGSNSSGEVLVGVNTVSASPQADHSRMYLAMPNGIQRFWVPFRYDGSTPLYFSLQFISLSHFLADGSTQSAFSCGAFQVNQGDTPALWKQPVDSAAAPTTNITSNTKQQVCHASAAPVSGTYNRGDVVYNTAPSASGVFCWVCTAGGTGGSAVFKAVAIGA